MLKKLLSGATFGTGFSIAALSVYTAWMFYVLPPIIGQKITSDFAVTENSSQLQEFLTRLIFMNCLSTKKLNWPQLSSL